MTETPNKNLNPAVTQLDVESWMQHVGEMGIYDKPIEYIGPNGPETATIIDDVMRADLDEQGNRVGVTPIVRLQSEDGAITDLPIKDLLSQGTWLQDLADFKEMRAAKLQAEYWAKQEAEAKRRQEAEDRKHEARVERNKKLFAPLDRPEKAGPEQSRYDSFVNAKTRELATEELRDATIYDEGLRDIINTYSAKTGITDKLAIVDALRTDAALRLQAGEYLLKKVDRLGYSARMPHRVAVDDEKRPTKSMSPIQYLRSREYTAFLCLAKIDGSFSPDLEENIHSYDERGVATAAQHRAAAEFVLKERGEEVPQQIGRAALGGHSYDHLFAA